MKRKTMNGVTIYKEFWIYKNEKPVTCKTYYRVGGDYEELDSFYQFDKLKDAKAFVDSMYARGVA